MLSSDMSNKIDNLTVDTPRLQNLDPLSFNKLDEIISSINTEDEESIIEHRLFPISEPIMSAMAMIDETG